MVETIDLGFAISISSLDAEQTFQKIKETVGSIVKRYGTGQIRYAIITYGSDPKLVLNFEETFPGVDGWLTKIDQIQKEGGKPALEKALKQAREMFGRSARPGAKKVLVVIADKSPIGNDDMTEYEARQLEIDDVKIIPVAVGKDIDSGEITKTSPYKDVLVETEKAIEPEDLGEVIMVKVFRGMKQISLK